METVSYTFCFVRLHLVRCAASLRAEALALGVSINADMIPARTTFSRLSAVQVFGTLGAHSFPLNRHCLILLYSCYSTIPLFPSFLHSVFFAIKTCHSPVIPSTPTRTQLPSLCSLPALRRRDLTSDATSSPDFVQAPAGFFHYCSLFLIMVLY